MYLAVIRLQFNLTLRRINSALHWRVNAPLRLLLMNTFESKRQSSTISNVLLESADLRNEGNWIQPWTKEQCQAKYLYSHEITLNQIAKASGVSYSTLKYWCKTDQWVNRRKEVFKNAAVAIERRAAQDVADQMRWEMADLQMEHYTAYNLQRALATLYFKAQNKKIAVARNLGEDGLIDAIDSIKVADCDKWSQILDRAIKGERQAAGMDLEADINKAMRLIEQYVGKVVPFEDWEATVKQED